MFSHAVVETRLCTNSFKDVVALLMAVCGEENPIACKKMPFLWCVTEFLQKW